MPDNGKAHRIDEEQVSVDALIHCLKHQHQCKSVDSHRNPNDPPDFWITINGTSFAAEVTSIVSGEDYRAICKNLKREIGHAAQKAGHRVGAYALELGRKPEIPKPNSDARRALVDKAVSFICKTQHAAPALEKPTLIKDDKGDLRIVKLPEQGAAVELAICPRPKRQGNVHSELRELMHDAISCKRKKLRRKGICGARTILLLYDAYGYADPEDAQKTLLEVHGYDWFHSVFWAASFSDRSNQLDPTNPGRKGAFLFSKEPAWWTRPRAP